MAKDTLTVQFRLQAAFGTIQTLRRALADETLQRQLVSLLGETVTPFLARQSGADFDLTVALKVSAVSHPRPSSRSPLPKVEHDQLTWYDEYAHLTNTLGAVGSTEWHQWLEAAGTTSFRYESDLGDFTAIKEKRRGRSVWYAHRRHEGRLKRVYLGRSANLTAAKLAQTAHQLNASQSSISLMSETEVGQRGGAQIHPSQ